MQLDDAQLQTFLEEEEEPANAVIDTLREVGKFPNTVITANNGTEIIILEGPSDDVQPEEDSTDEIVGRYGYTTYIYQTLPATERLLIVLVLAENTSTIRDES